MFGLLLTAAYVTCSSLVGAFVSEQRGSGFQVTLTDYHGEGTVVLATRQGAYLLLVVSPSPVTGRGKMWGDLGQCTRKDGKAAHVYRAAVVKRDSI